jgi:hypothetical protein
MSRGFVKEDDQEEIPIVPPRADLPEGVANYVTQVGMNELLTEKHMLVNKLIGDKAILKRGQEDLVFEIIDITY